MPGAATIWNAFWELSTERQVGFGVGEIPFRAIVTYADRYGVHDLDAFDEFRALIRAMDDVFLTKVASDSPTSKDTPVVSERPLTMDLFDALFS